MNNPVWCLPSEIEPGDMFVLGENLATVLLRKTPDGKFWFSFPCAPGDIRMEFFPGSPFTWNDAQHRFIRVDGADAVRIRGETVPVFRGIARNAASVFDDFPDDGDIGDISSSRMREIMEENRHLLARLWAVFRNEMERDSIRAMQKLLLMLAEYPSDVRAVLLAFVVAKAIDTQQLPAANHAGSSPKPVDEGKRPPLATRSENPLVERFYAGALKEGWMPMYF